MTTESTLILLGILTALSPYLGLPYSWLMWIVPVLAMAITGIGIVLRARRLPSKESPQSHIEVILPPQVLDEASTA